MTNVCGSFPPVFLRDQLGFLIHALLSYDLSYVLVFAPSCTWSPLPLLLHHPLLAPPPDPWTNHLLKLFHFDAPPVPQAQHVQSLIHPHGRSAYPPPFCFLINGSIKCWLQYGRNAGVHHTTEPACCTLKCLTTDLKWILNNGVKLPVSLVSLSSL